MLATVRIRRPRSTVNLPRLSTAPDARMFGSLAGAPADTGNYRSRILAVHQTGDAAFATVAEEGYWGSDLSIDHLSRAKIDGTWQIVSKLLANTGGEAPELG